MVKVDKLLLSLSLSRVNKKKQWSINILIIEKYILNFNCYKT